MLVLALLWNFDSIAGHQRKKFSHIIYNVSGVMMLLPQCFPSAEYVQTATEDPAAG